MTRQHNNIISQSAFDQLLLTYNASTRFADLLNFNGYTTVLENIHIAPQHSLSIDFSDCHFKNATFSGDLSFSNFNRSSFSHVEFSKATLNTSSFENITMDHSKATDTTFHESWFINSKLSNDSFYHCDFSDSAIVNSDLNKNIFSKSLFTNTYDSRNKATDLHLVFNQPYQQETVFKDAQKHLVKPTVAIVDDSEWHGTPYYILSQYGAEPKTINQTDPLIDHLQLGEEVKYAINNIKTHGLSDNSIAEQVINSGQPVIQSIKDYAYHIMTDADALWIPGGPDLHPEFYNETNTQSYPSYSYYREILEFSLTQAAITMDKPIIGICHGSQLLNVYLGGSLHQHVDTPSGEVDLIAHTKEGLLGSVIEDTLIGPSYHHQAVKRVADTLEVVASYNGVIKATQATDGKKIIGCQYHPEYEADKSSINVLNQFVNLSSEKKIQSTVLKLADVIDMNHDVLAANNPTATVATPAACVHEPCITQHLPVLPQLAAEIVHC